MEYTDEHTLKYGQNEAKDEVDKMLQDDPEPTNICP
jgi:hypothetical protein